MTPRERLAGFIAGGPTAPRTLLVVAHPDDETIFAGSRFGDVPDLTIVHVTDGAPRRHVEAQAAGCRTRDAYARLRRRELARALALAGVDPSRVFALGVADQEASFRLAWIARRIARLVQRVAPELVLTHPYEGGHPDHDACAFACHAGLELARAPEGPEPLLAEFASYHRIGDAPLSVDFLPAEGHEPFVLPLDGAARARKERILSAFASQQAIIASFPHVTERFRIAPRYDFTQPPHAGRLHYERFDWGITGEAWRRRAAEALRTLREEQAA